MLDDCREVLGKDNDERLAFFPVPQNSIDPWHGYPVDSADLGDDRKQSFFAVLRVN